MKRHNTPQIISIIFLALFCIGSTELIACSLFAPATFQQITAPVKTLANTVLVQGHTLSAEIAAWYDDITAPKVDESLSENAQKADDPMYKSAASVLDPAITELVYKGDTAILTGGILPIVYYNQSDEIWAEQLYGTDDIGHYGCGPTAMAMAVQSMTGKVINPAQMAEIAVKAGHWAKKQGSYLSIVEGLAEDYGLKAAALTSKTPDAIQDALFSGKLLVALMGPGHFTSGGHFILIRGITLEGTLLIADPNSTEHSLQEWDPQLILDELSHSTKNGAPLWTLEYQYEN